MTALVWLYRDAVFMIACLLSATLMQLLIRKYDFLFSVPVGLGTLTLGVGCAWFALQSWRFASPIRSAAVVGVKHEDEL